MVAMSPRAEPRHRSSPRLLYGSVAVGLAFAYVDGQWLHLGNWSTLIPVAIIMLGILFVLRRELR
jgi:Flp pilus assembly protein TadB